MPDFIGSRDLPGDLLRESVVSVSNDCDAHGEQRFGSGREETDGLATLRGLDGE